MTLVEIRATERPGAYLVRVDGQDQSLVDLTDPTHLGFDYVRRLGDVLDAVATAGQPLRVVHVGGAGLTLPRYVAATRPGSRQIVLEPDEQLTAQVRAELPVPRRSGIRVRPVDGRSGLAAMPDGSADIVVLDAYVDGRVPDDLLTAECLEDIARVLGPGGTFMANLSDAAPFPLTRSVVAGLAGRFEQLTVSAEPPTLKGRRPGNLVTVAGPAHRSAQALTRGASASATPYRVVTGPQVADWFGGGTPARDGPGLLPPATAPAQGGEPHES